MFLTLDSEDHYLYTQNTFPQLLSSISCPRLIITNNVPPPNHDCKHLMFDCPLLCFQHACSSSSLTIILQSLHVIQATWLTSEEISFLLLRASPFPFSHISSTLCLHSSYTISLDLSIGSSPAAFRLALLYFLGWIFLITPVPAYFSFLERSCLILLFK